MVPALHTEIFLALAGGLQLPSGRTHTGRRCSSSVLGFSQGMNCAATALLDVGFQGVTYGIHQDPCGT